ncbi:HD domain-containing protein [Candidatus Woesearchaeota archaeon]|nr:HD domain-containing protein [Candidatus Woesearchaeota archaeon]
MGKNEGYHHFKGNKLNRSEFVQRKVIELILKSKLTDKERESSKVFELKHSSGCVQVGRILAEKRRLNKEYAELICALHDIQVIVKGKYKDHAHLGAPIAEKILRATVKFNEKEIKIISEAIFHHSDKHIYTKNPYVELAKDADTLDCFLYDNVEGYYTGNKPPKVAKEYFKRIIKLRKEMGMRPVKKYEAIIKQIDKKIKNGNKTN